MYTSAGRRIPGSTLPCQAHTMPIVSAELVTLLVPVLGGVSSSG